MKYLLEVTVPDEQDHDIHNTNELLQALEDITKEFGCSITVSLAILSNRKAARNKQTA